jgi:DNA-binding beta-propeller fold protein YncE
MPRPISFRRFVEGFEPLETRLLLNAAPVATSDAYVTNVDSTLRVTDPAAVPPGGSFPGLSPRQSIALGYGVAEIESMPEYGLIAVRQGNSRVHILDARTGAELSVENARESFTDADVSPDGRFLYVADYGGTHIGYGSPSRTSYVHRFDALTGT